MLPAVRTFVQKYMGQKYVQPPPFDLHACYADSSATRPLIFVLSAGSDPTAALLQFATEKGMASRLRTISLGQGQGPKAAALIASASVAGDWVALQVISTLLKLLASSNAIPFAVFGMSSWLFELEQCSLTCAQHQKRQHPTRHQPL